MGGKGKGKRVHHHDPRVAAHLAEVEERKRAIYEEHGIPYPGQSSPQSGSIAPSIPASVSPSSSGSLPTPPLGGISGSPGSSNIGALPIDAASSINAIAPISGAISGSPGSGNIGALPIDAASSINAIAPIAGNSANSPIPIPSSADLGSSLPMIISASSGVTNSNDNGGSWEDLVRNGNRKLQSSSNLGIVPPIVKKVATKKVQKS